MIGGAYLCFEGFEKIAPMFLLSKEEHTAHKEELMNALVSPDVDLAVLEKDKIKGAIRTDFVLSAEIIVIALGTVAMFMVGGGILVHSFPWLSHAVEALAMPLGTLKVLGTMLFDALAGIVAGAMVLGMWCWGCGRG